MRHSSWLSASLMAVLALCGCSSSRDAAAKYRIAVIPKGTSHSFWKSIHAGAVQAARERGNAQILWDGPAKEDQRDKQQQIVERFTFEGVDAIVLAPCDRQTLVAPVEATLQKGIPVVIIDSGLQLTDAIKNSSKYLGYVATDNHQGGVEAAKRMIHLLKEKKSARVLMLRYQTGSESTEQREAGFQETIRTAPNIDFIVAADEAGATKDSAQKVVERLLNDHKDLDGLFVPNESSADGALEALELLHRTPQVKLVGFDANSDLIKALQTGRLFGLVLQDPFDMGHQSVLRAIDFLEGKPPKDKVRNTRLTVLTKENMHDPALKPLYDRDLAPYLGE